MSESKPFASLVLLSYKRPDHLERSLDSLLNSDNQTHFELIVVDDGSGDACVSRLVQALRLRDLSTVIFNAGGNMGVGVGINRGFQVAQGRWLVKLDADLEYADGWLDAAVELLEARADVANVGFFDFLHYDPSREAEFGRLGELKDRNGKLVGYEVRDFVGSAFAMRRTDFLKQGVVDGVWVGFPQYSDAFAEDVEWKRARQAEGHKLAILPEDLVKNFGFGLGNSTVVEADENGQPRVAKIHKSPLVFGRATA